MTGLPEYSLQDIPSAVVYLVAIPSVDAGSSGDTDISRPVVYVHAVVSVDDIVAARRVACRHLRNALNEIATGYGLQIKNLTIFIS